MRGIFEFVCKVVKHFVQEQILALVVNCEKPQLEEEKQVLLSASRANVVIFLHLKKVSFLSFKSKQQFCSIHIRMYIVMSELCHRMKAK